MHTVRSKEEVDSARRRETKEGWKQEMREKGRRVR